MYMTHTMQSYIPIVLLNMYLAVVMIGLTVIHPHNTYLNIIKPYMSITTVHVINVYYFYEYYYYYYYYYY